MIAETINTAGLLLDILGACMLVKYGLPNDVSESGGIVIVYPGGENTQAEKRKWRKYRRNSRIALGLLILGFAMQIFSNHYTWLFVATELPAHSNMMRILGGLP